MVSTYNTFRLVVIRRPMLVPEALRARNAAASRGNGSVTRTVLPHAV